MLNLLRPKRKFFLIFNLMCTLLDFVTSHSYTLLLPTSATDSLSTKDPAAVDTEEAVVEEEPEEQTKTLDEYLASKKQAAASALPEPRKPNEGSDDAKWKDAVALEKPEEEDFFGGKVKKENFLMQEIFMQRY